MDNQIKILIIDDEEVVLDSCTQILKGEGDNYLVETAVNGMIGLERVREFQPDLVFVDLKMPGISGVEVIGKIREINPTIVVIVITGFATVSSAVEAMKQGAFDFLPKPFTPDELRLIHLRGLENRRLLLNTIALRREKEMLREHFATIVSHELKSPLNALQQNLYGLRGELAIKLTENQLGLLDRMISRVDDLLKLIMTWLRVISVDIGKIQEHFQPISFQTVISKAKDNVEIQAIRKDIEIINKIKEPLRLVNGDEGTLVEALVNLLGNAIKFSRVGSKVQVKAEEAKDELVVSITDTGVGISKDDLPYIFNDFYVGSANQIVEKGTGLGLAITRRIIEAHHGTISVDSKLESGSTFTIRLPVL